MLQWDKQPLNQELARKLRAATRRKPALHGHTFEYNDLRELWVANDVHIVLTHEKDPVWQYWYQVPVGGWQPISIHQTREEAQAAAPERAPSDPPLAEPGTYVLFRFNDSRPWQRTRVESSGGTEFLTGMYERLGCEVQVETINA